MKTLTSRTSLVCTVGSLFLGSAPGLLAADIVLQKVPPLTVEQSPAYPENLARHQLGARLETVAASSKSADMKQAESALLSGDPAASYTLPLGTTTLLVALPKIENVASISLVNQGAKGSVSVATSNAKLPADSPQWHNALDRELSSEAIAAKVGPSEAKYVRLTFNVTQPGQIAGLGIYSTPQVSDFTAARKSSSADNGMTLGLVSYNHADMHAKARALYVSSGADLKNANNMIDDQAATTYNFAAEDGSPTTVIDLGKTRTLRRLSAVYSARAGNMSFYVMSKLPGAQKASAPGADAAPMSEVAPDAMTLNDEAVAGMKAVGSATDDGSIGRASVDFPATTGRYVMVRWAPAAQQDGSFTMAEIAAIGGQNSNLLAANTTDAAVDAENADRTMTADGKTTMDGKTVIDAKDMPGEGPVEEAPQSPAEGPPPTLPQPPPFTFVPVLVPTSP